MYVTTYQRTIVFSTTPTYLSPYLLIPCRIALFTVSPAAAAAAAAAEHLHQRRPSRAVPRESGGACGSAGRGRGRDRAELPRLTDRRRPVMTLSG